MIMNNIKWIFFDLDGTLIDNMPVMYGVYLDFLDEYGIKGNKKEFEKLNGPALHEIIMILKNKHNLKETKKNLLQNYTQKLECAYKKIHPTKQTVKLLKTLINNNYKLALVTSSPKSLANIVIKQCAWKKYFSSCVFGNEIVHSKPHPEIYKLCLEKTKATKKQVLVVEDSINGYKSATKAGLKCILLSKKIKLNQISKLKKL